MCKGDVFLRFIDESRRSIDENASRCSDENASQCSDEIASRCIDENASRCSNENASRCIDENASRLSIDEIASRFSIDENASRRIDDGSTPFSFVAYVGDGPNDFCPMLKLGPSDLVSIFKACWTKSLLKSSWYLRPKMENQMTENITKRPKK